MKDFFVKFLLLSIAGIMLYPILAIAQEAVAPAVPIVSKFDLKVFIQQCLTNGGFVLLAFLFGKIPVVGVYLQKFLDVFMANPKH